MFLKVSFTIVNRFIVNNDISVFIMAIIGINLVIVKEYHCMTTIDDYKSFHNLSSF